ncbi:aminomethyltransferase family protein [Methylotenera sp.]|uniref:aminomethyltransferase family protein n=1 Tax=Methylotenera sp. TaxID=2051956 RepID=UPI0024892EA4|nr:aminomethyltransferase family protein [Methylotenera sp.]MDI1300255.1 aminomethyltransferase family protein [Methylotenera sp.]
MMRNSILNDRHATLGSSLDGDKWNDMAIPWSYHTDPNEETIAVRSRAALFDVSALNLVDVTGTDAEAVLNAMVAKDIIKLKVNTGIIAAEMNEAGELCDDIMIIRLGANEFKISHGSGKTPDNLSKLSAGKNIKVQKDDDTHVLSLQGPKSLEILTPHVGIILSELPYFGFVKTTLFGIHVIIGRGGYAAERGYEIYSSAKNTVTIWDKILEIGKPFGIMPASWNCLELTRVEAALQFFPFEMPEGDTTPWEAGLGWAIDSDKAAEYTGKAAALKSKGQERVKQGGLVCQSATAVEAGAKIMKNGIEVGVVTSSSYSQYLMQSIAMMHIKPEYSAIGTEVEIVGKITSCKARVAQTPFYDPMRLRTYPERVKG